MSKYIMEVKVIGDLFEDNGHGSMAGRVYDTDGQCQALGASHFQQIKYILDKKNVDEVKELGFMDNETQQIKVLTEQYIVAMRGRNPENPSDRTVGAPTELWKQWHFEQNVYDSDGIVRSVKAGGGSGNIPKVIETQYRIRKLTPRECYRLMAVPEKDIDKMLEVNSNTQCYKQAGNSIVVNCLVAIFSQMGIQGIPRWNDGLSEKYK